jgi:hypothetical protein
MGLFYFDLLIFKPSASRRIVSVCVPDFDEDLLETLCPLHGSLHHDVVLFLLYLGQFCLQSVVHKSRPFFDPLHSLAQRFPAYTVYHGEGSVEVVIVD